MTWYSTILTKPGPWKKDETWWNYILSIKYVNLKKSNFSWIREISQTVLWDNFTTSSAGRIAPPWHLMHKAPKVSATAPSAPFTQDALDAWGVVQRCCQNKVPRVLLWWFYWWNQGSTKRLIPYFVQRNLAWPQPDFDLQISKKIDAIVFTVQESWQSETLLGWTCMWPLLLSADPKSRDQGSVARSAAALK